MITENDIGWLAGVVDLKGRISYKKNKMRNTPQIVLVVESKEREVIIGLSELTGTSPEELNSVRRIPEFMRKSCSEHCPEDHVHVLLSLPPISRWTITGAALAVVLYNIMPYLRNKKDYPELFAQLMRTTVLVGQGRGKTVEALKRLYGLGWMLPYEFEVHLAEKVDEQEVPILP